MMTTVYSVKQHRKKLDELIAALEEKETLYREDIERCLGPVVAKKPLENISM